MNKNNSMWCADGTFNGKKIFTCSMPPTSQGLVLNNNQPIVLGNSFLTADTRSVNLIGKQQNGQGPMVPASGSMFTSDRIATNTLMVGDVSIRNLNGDQVSLIQTLTNAFQKIESRINALEKN